MSGRSGCRLARKWIALKPCDWSHFIYHAMLCTSRPSRTGAPLAAAPVDALMEPLAVGQQHAVVAANSMKPAGTVIPRAVSGSAARRAARGGWRAALLVASPRGHVRVLVAPAVAAARGGDCADEREQQRRPRDRIALMVPEGEIATSRRQGARLFSLTRCGVVAASHFLRPPGAVDAAHEGITQLLRAEAEAMSSAAKDGAPPQPPSPAPPACELVAIKTQGRAARARPPAHAFPHAPPRRAGEHQQGRGDHDALQSGRPSTSRKQAAPPVLAQ